MTSIYSVKDLQEHFFVPIFFKYQNDRMLILKIQITNLVDAIVYTENLTLKAWSNTDYSFLAFKQLEQYLDNIGSASIEDFCAMVYQASNIYKNSIHQLQITAIGNNQTITITRYFLIPAIVAQSTTSLSQLNITAPTCDVYVAVNDLNIISINTALIANCTFSDVEIYSTTYTDLTKLIHQSINVSNYDMSELIFYAIATFSDNTKSLIATSIIGQTTILTPKISIVKGDISLSPDKTKRRLNFSLRIQSPTYDGIQWIDKGSMFYSKGIQFSVDGNNNPTIEVSRLTGAQP